MSDGLREYIVTLKHASMLDDFYEDMETPGGDLYIPDRRVDLANRRPISRNTHYYLTESEANQLKLDPRVLDVDLTPKEKGLVLEPQIRNPTYPIDWNKNTSTGQYMKNWGLLRCFEGANVEPNWTNSTGDPVEYSSRTTAFGDVIPFYLTRTGKNVDVVIVDGHIPVRDNVLETLHPEYRANEDGTGPSRFVWYNWLAPSGGVYKYQSTLASEQSVSNHGIHVAGTAAGNTQGWASDANIYNISPYGTEGNLNGGTDYVIDRIREFHNSKPINPVTGRKNPTITNHSYLYLKNFNNNDIHRVVIRGSTVYDKSSDGILTAAKAYNFAIGNVYTYTSAFFYLQCYDRIAWQDADIQDAIDDGIIMVGAAGNWNTYIDIPIGIDYNNYIIYNGSSGPQHYVHRGATPGSSPGMITVGATSPNRDNRASFSSFGPRIDVWAPGVNIMGSIRSTQGGSVDLRDSNFRNGKLSGTSMASPQVCGVLACALEEHPEWTQIDAINYLKRSSSAFGQALNVSYQPPPSSPYPVNGPSTTRCLRYLNETRGEGVFWPDNNSGTRKVERGVLWPRKISN